MPPFSASTCLTNLGTTPLGPTLYAYSDTDGYLISFASVLTSQISGSSCPYILTNIPEGTIYVRLIDPITSCCITLPVQSDNFCNTCDLGFDLYPLETNSQILAGNLTGSCENITDYRIFWYGPNSDVNIAFTSGKGSLYSYSFTHPLTGSSFIFANAGYYTPVIDRVRISGITFSNTGGTGGVYDATLNCFDDQRVQVLPLTCDNGNTPTSDYTHTYYFSGTGASAVPLNVTFLLSANTNYFAYSFTGQQVPDSFKITYSGANITPNQVILENIQVGTDVSTTSLNWTNSPRRLKETNFKRVLCLTGLTRPPGGGDTLSIQIVPNPGNTIWSLDLKCLESFDCSTCPTDTYRNQSMKIIKNTIAALVDTNGCYTNVVYFVSACTLASVANTQINKYFNSTKLIFLGFFTQNSSYALANGLGNDINKIGSDAAQRLTYNSSSCSNSAFLPLDSAISCRTSPPAGNITFTKSIVGGLGQIDLVSSNPEHISYYWSSYLSAINSTSVPWGYSACTAVPYPNATGPNLNQGPYSGGTFTGTTTSPFQPRDPRYYRNLWLIVPSATGNTACRQNTPEGLGVGFVGNVTGGLFQSYAFHTSSTVTTGTTGPNYYFRIVMNTMTPLNFYETCRIDCNFRSQQVANGNGYSVNEMSTATTYNIAFTNTAAAMVNNPIVRGFFTSETCTISSAYTHSKSCRYNNYANITMPTNLTTNQIIPSYSGVVCPFIIKNTENASELISMVHFACTTKLLPTGPQDYEILCNNITNWTQSTVELAYRFTGGTEQFCNPNYVIGC